MMPKEKQNKRSRGKYEYWLTDEGLIKIEGWAKDGLTDKQIAHNVGVAERTFTEWKRRFNTLTTVLKRGKEVVDREVENALLKNALGFEYEETKTIIEITPNGERKQRIEKVKKYNPPNPTSQIFWLKNRKPADWRDRKEVDANVKEGKIIFVDDISGVGDG